MVQFFQQQPGQSSADLMSQSIGQGFGGGFQQGMSSQIQGMLEMKQNLNSAESIADQLKLRGDEKTALVGTLSNIPAKSQLAALAKLSEAQIYNSYLQSQQAPQGFDFGDQSGFGGMNQFQQPQQQSQMPITDAIRSVNSMAPVNAMINAAMGVNQAPQQQMQQAAPPTADQFAMQPQAAPQGTQQQRAPQERTQKIGGFDMSERDLNRIRRQPQIPPFGFSAKAADIQDRNLKENRKEIAEYAEKYATMPELESNVNRLQEARKIIQKPGFDVSNLRKAIIAISEGHESGLAELFKTPDQQKLLYLLRNSIKPKELGGSNPSTKEVLISMGTIPGYLKGKEANEYIINQMVKNAEKDLARGSLISNLRRYNPSAEPAEFKSLVDDKMNQKFGNPNTSPSSQESGLVTIRLPDGSLGEIPRQNLDTAIKRGAEVVE